MITTSGVMNPMAKARGLQLGRLARRVRLHDGSPARNVASSDGISRPSEAAADTPEMRLRRTVGFCHMPAGGAGPGGVPGIDKDHRNACQTSLVLDEGAKLMERPTVLDATLSLLNREPFADALELFQGDAATGVFGLRDQPLADDVVNVAGEPLLLPPTLFEEPFGGLGSLGLKPRPELRITLSQAVQVPAEVGLAVRVGGDVDDAEVHAKPVFWAFGRRLRHVHHHGQIEAPVAVDEVSLPPDVLQPRRLVSAKHDGDDLPALKRQDGHSVQALPGENALIIDDGSARAEGRLLGPVPLVGFRDLADDADGHLSRQAKPFPDVVVDEFLESDLVGRLLPEGDFGNSVTRRVEPLHRLQKGGGLLGRRLKLDHQRQVHVLIITRNPQSRKCGSHPSSPRLKAGASGRRFW